jgi:hypothetical protein
MKYDPKHFDMMSVYEFARLLGSDYVNIGFHKEHGSFMGEFQKDSRLPRSVVEFYIRNRGIGVLFSDSTQSQGKPSTCCRSGSESICRMANKEGRILTTISKLEELVHPVPEILIWHDTFLQTNNCFLKNISEYMYLLFHLVDTGKLIRVKNIDGDDLYSVSLVPKKRAVGRPRKYI